MAPVAKSVVAESPVALEVEPEVAEVRLPKGKRSRLTVGEGEESGDEAKVMTVVLVVEDREVIVAPLGPRGYGGRVVVPAGPRRRGESSLREVSYVRR